MMNPMRNGFKCPTGQLQYHRRDRRNLILVGQEGQKRYHANLEGASTPDASFTKILSNASEFSYLHQTQATDNLVHCAYDERAWNLKKVVLNEDLHYKDSSSIGASLFLSDTSKTTETAMGTWHNWRSGKQGAYPNQVRGLAFVRKLRTII